MAEKRLTKKKIGSLLSISHDKDVDGLNSAAIVWRYAKSKGLDFDMVLTDYGGFVRTFSSVATRRNTLIIVTDLGMDDSVLDAVVAGLSRAISQGCRVVWLDHHQWSDRAVRSILSLENKPVLKVNPEYCAAEITHKVLMPRDEICAELATVAHDTDFNFRQIDGAGALTDAVSVIRFSTIASKEDLTAALRPIVEKLAEKGLAGVWNEQAKRFHDSLLDKRVHHYRKEKLKKMRKALIGHCDQEIHERLVRVLEMPSGVTTTDMGTFIADSENLAVDGTQLKVADLVITVSSGGMLGFRRGYETTLCNIAAKLFNGGGHPYAAGGEYGVYTDFQAVCDDIFVTLSKSKDWVIEADSV